MAGGGKIAISVNVNLNVKGLDALMKADRVLDELNKKKAALTSSPSGGTSGGSKATPTAGSISADSSKQQRQSAALAQADKRLESAAAKAAVKLESAAQAASKFKETVNRASDTTRRPSTSGGGRGGSGGGGPIGGGGPPERPKGTGLGGARGGFTFGSQLASVARFAVAAKIIQSGFDGISKAVTAIGDVDTELAELNKVLATSDENLQNLRRSAVATGKEFGSSIATVLRGFKVFAQQGLSEEQVVQRGKAVQLAENVSTLNTEEAAETITAGLKVYGDQVGDSAERLIDSFVAVESQNAVTAADLSEVVKRVGIAAKNAGTTFDELNAFTTVIQESTRAGGGRISRVLKFSFKNLFDQARQGDLQAIGVSTKDAGGDLRDATDVLGDIAKRWDALSRAQKRNIAVGIGGTRFQNEFSALMENFGKVSQVAAQSQNAAGTATERNAIIMQSLSKRAAKVGASFEGLATAFGEGLSAPLSAALTVADKLLTVLTQIAEIKLPGGVTAGDVGGFALGTAGLLFGGKAAGKLVKGAGGLLGLGGGAAAATGAGTAAVAGAGAGATEAMVAGGLLATMKSGMSKAFARFGDIKGLASIGTKLASFGRMLAGLPRIGALFGLLGRALAPLIAVLGLPGAPLIALAAAATGAVVAINRMSESSEETDQRTGLNTRRAENRAVLNQFQPLAQAADRFEFQRKELAKNLEEGKIGSSEAKELARNIDLKEEANQRSIRDAIIKGGDKLAKEIPGLEITNENEVLFRGKDILQDPKAAGDAARAVQRQTKNQENAINAQKTFNRIIRGEQEQQSEDLKIARSALQKVEKAGRITKEDTFRDDRTGKEISEEEFKSRISAARRSRSGIGPQVSKVEGLTAAEFDAVKDEKKLAKARRELTRDLGRTALTAAREGRLGRQITQNQLVEEGLSSRQRSRVERLVVDTMNLENPEKAQENLREVQALDDQRLITRALDMSLGNELNNFVRASETALKDAGLSPRDLQKDIFGARDEQGQLIDGKQVADRVKEGYLLGAREGTVFRKTDDAGKILSEFVKVGEDRVAQTVRDGQRLQSPNLLPGDIASSLKDFSGAVLSASQSVEQFVQGLDKDVISTGFGAGRGVLGDDFNSGRNRLQDFSDQAAGSIFNQGLRQFLTRAERERKEAQKKIDAGELTATSEGENLQERTRKNTGASLIAKAAETMGVAAKSIERAADNFQRFQTERQTRAEAPISALENELMPGGFESVQLGRTFQELPAELKAQARNPELTRRLADNQQLQKGFQQAINDIEGSFSNLRSVIGSLSEEDIRRQDTGVIRSLLEASPDERLTEADLLTKLEGVTKFRDEDPLSEGGIAELREALFQALTKRPRETLSDIRSQAASNTGLIKMDETALKAAIAIERLKSSAESGNQAFEDLKQAGSNLDRALSSSFNRQGAAAQRVFTGRRGDNISQLSQVGGLENLNQFQREIRLANLLSSKAVQQGRVNVFDENRQRISPISRDEAQARIQDARLNARRARRLEEEQEGRRQFSARRGQLEQALGELRGVKRLGISEDFNKAIARVEQSLVNIQTSDPKSFFSRSGRFNESSFSALTNLSTNLDREMKKLGPEAFKDITASQAMEMQGLLGKDRAKEIIKSLQESGGMTADEATQAVAQGLMDKDEAAASKKEMNASKFEPITSKLDVIATLVSQIVALMGGKADEGSTKTKIADDIRAAAEKKVQEAQKTTEAINDKKQSIETKDSQEPSTSEPSRGTIQEFKKSLKGAGSKATDEAVSNLVNEANRASKPLKSISDLDFSKVITNADLEGLDTSDVRKLQSGARSFSSDRRFAESFGRVTDLNKQLGRTAETDKLAVANLLKNTPLSPAEEYSRMQSQQDQPVLEKQPLTPFQESSKAARMRLGASAEAAEAFARNQPQPDPQNRFLTTQNDQGESIRHVLNDKGEFTRAGNDGAAFRNAMSGGLNQDQLSRIAQAQAAEQDRLRQSLTQQPISNINRGDSSDSRSSDALQNIERANQAFMKVAESASRAAGAQDTNSQRNQNRQEEAISAQQKIAKATTETADLQHGRTTPDNRRQAAENNEVTLDTDAIQNAVAAGAERGSQAGVERAAPTIGQSLESANLRVSLEGGEGIGGAISSLEDKFDSFAQTQESQIVALQDRQVEAEEAIMSSIEQVSTKLNTVETKSQDTEVAITNLNQKITDSESKLTDLETSMAEGAQPLEEANQRAEDAASRAESALTQVGTLQAEIESVRGQLASVEGRLIFT